MIYTLIFAILAVLALALRYSPSIRNPTYAVVLVLLFAFVAFRLEVGCDWPGYLNQFRYAQSHEVVSAVSEFRDPFWWLLISEIRDFGLTYPWLNVAAAILFFLGVHFFASRQPDRLAFLVLLFPILIINMPMSGIRQAAAIGVLCMAFVAFLDRRPYWFGGLVLLASGFHTSAILFLLLLPLVKGTYSKGRISLAALLAVPGIWFMLGSEAAEVAIARYITTEVDAHGAIFRVGLLALSGLFFFVVLRRDWLKAEPQAYKLVSLGAIGMIGLVALLPFSTVVADRLGYYFIPIQAMMLARIPFLAVGRNNLVYVILPYAVLGLSFVVWTMLSLHFEQCYIPYQTWLF